MIVVVLVAVMIIITIITSLHRQGLPQQGFVRLRPLRWNRNPRPRPEDITQKRISYDNNSNDRSTNSTHNVYNNIDNHRWNRNPRAQPQKFSKLLICFRYTTSHLSKAAIWGSSWGKGFRFHGSRPLASHPKQTTHKRTNIQYN